YVTLADVVANLFDRALERITVTAAAARANLEGVAGLELRHQHLGVGEIALPLPADAQLHRVAGSVEAAVEPPWPAMRPLALIVDHHVRARAHHALDPEPAAAAAGAAGIGHQGIALHYDGKLDLGLLVRAVVGIAVVDADRARDAVLGQLGAPAAAQGSEAADEELGGAIVDAVKRRRQKVGVVAGDDAAGNGRGQRLENRVDDGHRVGHPPAHGCRPHRA